jgi:hypothetical protein
MKTKLFLIAFVISILNAAATVLTVSNHVLGGAQYANMQSAINAASNFDSLIVEGSLTVYDMDYLSKPLVVIGQGLNTQKQNFKQTKFGKGSSGPGSAGSYSMTGGSSGSKFYGINFFIDASSSSNPVQALTIGASNLLFENCMFDRLVYVSGNNITFKNCIFIQPGELRLTGVISNILFMNCVFNGQIYGGSSGETQIVTIDHSLLLSTGACFVDCLGFDIRNNIFMNTTGVSGITSGTFQNNLCRNSFTFPPAMNTNNGGNLTGTDPLFTTYTFGEMYSPSQDYHLQLGSPATGAASDATEIGVHGGLTKFSETMEPLILPVVRSMNVTNFTVAPNGTINIQISASKPTGN